MASAVVYMRLAPLSAGAIVAFERCNIALDRIVSDQPWNDDAKSAQEALLEAMQCLKMEKEHVHERPRNNGS